MPQPIKFETTDPILANQLSVDDVQENAIIYLHQLNELQKAEYNSWCRQITTLGLFNEGATYRRNLAWNEKDHFTRLIEQIEILALYPLESGEKSLPECIQHMFKVYEEAFEAGCLLDNSMGDKLGRDSSYHVMLNRWARSLGVNVKRSFISHEISEIKINVETLEAQFKKYSEWTHYENLKDDESLYAKKCR